MSNNQNNNNNNVQNQQQNNQQGSLLRRVQNQNNNNNQQNNQNNQNNNNSLRSRFSNNNRFGNNQNQNQNQNQPPPKPAWTITPWGDAGVKFTFQGLGDPLFRILGTPLDTSLKDVESFIAKINGDDELFKQLAEKLDEAWEKYEFYGAAIMHPVRKNIQDAFTMQTMPILEEEQENQDNNNNNNPFSSSRFAPAPQLPPAPYDMYRAVDALFVINVLGRIRGNVLVQETPIALESGFMNQNYICDDPRLIDLALATGAIEETW